MSPEDSRHNNDPAADDGSRSPPPHDARGHDSDVPHDPLAEAVSEFARTWHAGQSVDPEEFCRTHLEGGPGLRAAIDAFLAREAGEQSAAGHHVTPADPASSTQDPSASEPPGEAPPSPSSRTPAQSAKAGAVLGDFRILRELGRGGMGVVYEAEQISVRRRVALKVLAPHLSLSEDAVERFRREAEAGGRQRHPGIVSVYAVGEEGGVHFIAHELVEGGETLADQLRTIPRGKGIRPDRCQRVAVLFAEVADALGHAHANGVIHRDVKPSNILLTRDGSPKVTDFGLAKLEDALALTRTGDFEGTPFYMSPEQVVRREGGIDHRTDVYSLGVALYEALTLRRPFEGESPLDVLKQVLRREPRDPRKIDPHIPRDLAVICLKAMEKEPAARYATMGDLARDLRRWMEGRTILARPAGLGTRTMKWTRRNRGIAIAGAAAFFVLFGAVGFRLVQHRLDTRAFDRHVQEANAAERAGNWDEAIEHTGQALVIRPDDALAKGLFERYHRERELVSQKERNDQLEGLLLASRSANLPDDKPVLSLLLALESVKRDTNLTTISAVAAALTNCRLLQTMVVRPYPFHPELQRLRKTHYWNAVFSPDAKRVLTTTHDNRPRIWDSETGGQVMTLDADDAFGQRFFDTCGGLFSPDGKRVVLAGASGLVLVFDAESGRLILRLPEQKNGVNNLRFSSDGRMLVTAPRDSTVRIWDAETGGELHVLRAPVGGSRTCFSPDGRYVAACFEDGTVRIWDAATGEPVRVFRGHEDKVRTAAFSPDGRYLGTAGDDFTLRIWDVATGEQLHLFRGEGNPLIGAHDVAFSPDGSLVTTTWGDTCVVIWSTGDGDPVAQLSGHRKIVRSVDFSPDGRRVLTSAFDHTARIWDPLTGEELVVLRGQEDFLHQAWFSPDGSRVLTISEDGTAGIWDAESEPRREECLTGRCYYLYFDEDSVAAPDGGRLEWSKHSKRAAIRSPDGVGRIPLEENPYDLTGARFSPDGAWIVTGSGDADSGLVRVWNARTGELRADSLLVPGGKIIGACFSEDSRLLTTASEYGPVRVWDLGAGEGRRESEMEEQLALVGHTRWVHSISYSADSARVATASSDYTTRIWDRETGEELAVLEGHEGDVLTAVFGPDGERVVTTSSDDHTARLWDARTGEELLILHAVDEVVGGVVGFSPDGSRVVSVAGDGTSRSWPVDVMGAAKARHLRVLSPEEKRKYDAWAPGEEEAYALADSLFAELALASDVITHLENSDSLASEVRDAALRFARMQEDNPRLLLRVYAPLLSDSSAEADVRDRAASVIRALGRHSSEFDPQFLRTVGSYLYLMGEYGESLRVLRECRDALHRDGEEVDLYVLGYIAMSHHRLGQAEEARAARRVVEALAETQGLAKGEPGFEFLERVRALIVGETGVG